MSADLNPTPVSLRRLFDIESVSHAEEMQGLLHYKENHPEARKKSPPGHYFCTIGRGDKLLTCRKARQISNLPPH
jgi:hypothetical protein